MWDVYVVFELGTYTKLKGEEPKKLEWSGIRPSTVAEIVSSKEKHKFLGVIYVLNRSKFTQGIRYRIIFEVYGQFSAEFT